MGEKEKVTIMVLKVDLQCHKCYKKVKNVLCKFPREIRDQKYDEKQNQVEIEVVSCSPEKIRDKIYCKGGCAIKCIEFKAHEPKPTKDGKKDNGKPTGEHKPKKDDYKENGVPILINGKPPKKDDYKENGVPIIINGKPPKKDDYKENGMPIIINGKPTGEEKPKKDNGKPKIVKDDDIDYGKPKDRVVIGYPPLVPACCMDCYRGHAGGPCYSGCGGRQCCCRCGGQQCYCRRGGRPCYSGCGGQPCYSGYGGQPAPYIQYDGYYGRLVYDNYSGDSRGYCVTRTNYFSEENPSACTVM